MLSNFIQTVDDSLRDPNIAKVLALVFKENTRMKGFLKRFGYQWLDVDIYVSFAPD